MAGLTEWLRRVWYLLNRRRKDDEVAREMASHRAMMQEPARFGNTLRLREEVSDVWRWAWLDNARRDLRYAIRSLAKVPQFAAAAVLSLAVGFALAASMVAVVNAYLIRSLPYPAASRIYQVIYAPPGQPEPRGLSSVDWSPLSDVVELRMTHSNGALYLTDGSYTSSADAAYVTPGFAEGLGMRAVIGRSFADADYLPGGGRVALIAHDFWRDRFSSDPNIVGRQFQAYSNRPDEVTTYTIIGVLPPGFWPGFRFGRFPEVFVPAPQGLGTYMVRLRDGVPMADAERRMTALMRSYAPSAPASWRVQLRSLHDQYVAEVRPMLAATTAAVAIVLVIVCANVAVLMLLRAARRQKEVALRLALGAARRHVLRMLVAESGLVCAIALVLGVALSWFTLRLLAPLVEQQLGRAAPGGTGAIAIDLGVLAIVCGVGVLIAAALSLTPLFASRRHGLANALRQDSRTGTESPRSRRLRSLLIVAEVAGSLALLVGCGLMLRTVVHLARTDLGFEIDRVVRSRIVLPAQAYPDPRSQAAFYDDLLRRLQERPGVRAIALSTWPPFYAPPPKPMEGDFGAVTSEAVTTSVTDDYFTALEIPIIAGRSFTPDDRVGGARVAIVSESLARRLWPGQPALGHRIRTIDSSQAGNPVSEWLTVVGVARDVRQTFTDDDLRDVYLPYLAAPGRFAGMYVRVDDPLVGWLGTFRAAVSEINRDVLVEGAVPLNQTADRQLAGGRFLASMLTAFAAFTAVLAMLGVYGVIAYAVQQREREVAIRTALGASRRGVIRLFLRDGGLVVASGLACGLLGAVGVAKLLERQLHGVGPFDLPILVVASAGMAVAGLLAVWWPARRAAMRSPIAVLKEG